MITASSFPRVFACPASEVLPHREVPNEWGSRGSAIATYRQHVGKMPWAELSQLIPAEHHKTVQALTDDTPADALREAAFAYDVETGRARLLGCGIDRRYSIAEFNLRATEVCGTADAVFREDGMLVVLDDKSAAGKRTQPEESRTMVFYAMCAALCDDAKPSEVALVYNNTDVGTTVHGTADLFDFAKLADDLKRLPGMLDEARTAHQSHEKLEVTEGAHCRYCPAQEECPAKRALAVRMQNNDLAAEIEMAWAGHLTAETAPRAYETYLAMKMLTKRASDILHAYAKEHPIKLANGRTFGPCTKRGNEKLDADIVYTLLVELCGEEAARDATKLVATKKDVECAVKAGARRGKKKQAWDAALKEIRERGGASRPPDRVVVEEYEGK